MISRIKGAGTIAYMRPVRRNADDCPFGRLSSGSGKDHPNMWNGCCDSVAVGVTDRVHSVNEIGLTLVDSREVLRLFSDSGDFILGLTRTSQYVRRVNWRARTRRWWLPLSSLAVQ